MNQNKHKFYMLQILRDIYNDAELGSCLAFKGGTALMFFYDLPRFSVDLDFNLLSLEKEDVVYKKVRSILLKYGKIDDEAQKHYGPIIVLDYGKDERKLKVEISNRQYDNHYEIKSLLGINVQVMVVEDMFAHKLCALLDRTELTSRDIFDCWFFLQRHTDVNRKIVEQRMKMPFGEYIGKCIEGIQSVPNTALLNGLGELMNPAQKSFVKNKMKSELISMLQFLQYLS